MPSVLNQFLATLTCNLLTACYGSMSAWSAPNFLVLTTEELSPLPTGALSTSEGALVVSLPSFGAMIGTLVYTVLCEKFSRRLLLVSIAIPQILVWVTILMTTSVYHLYVARFVGGLVGGGTMILVPIYVSEIAEDKVRGTLGSLLILTCNAGCLFAFIIPMFFDYYGQIKINLLLPILFLLAFKYFPETPEYLLKRNQKNAAQKATNFYRGVKNSPVLELKADEAEKTYEKVETDTNSTGLSLSDFLTPAAKKATAIALVMGGLNQLCGAFPMFSYTNKIFKDAGSTLSPDTATLIIGIVQLVANFVTLVTVDLAGRKILITISAVGTACGLVTMGVYDLFKVQLAAHAWIPIVAFSTITFMSSIGMLPLTFVVLSEVLPKKIKSAVTLIALEVLFIMSFILLSLLPTLSASFGMYSVTFMFATCCILGTIFYLIYLPETKGKTPDQIEKNWRIKRSDFVQIISLVAK